MNPRPNAAAFALSVAWLGLNLLPVTVAAQAPPTGLQNPLPTPALPLPTGDRPLKSSPTSKDLEAYIAKRTLNIQDVVAIALATNRTLATQVEAYLQAHGNTIAARSGLGPSLKASYTYLGYNQGQTADLGGQSVSIQEQYQNQVTASLSLPIDINGELTAATNQAKYQELAARIDIDRARNEIVLNAKTDFYAVLRAQALVTVDEDALQNAVDRLADARIRLRAGTVAKYDVMTAESDVAKAQETLIKDRSSLSQAFATLNYVLGIDVDTALNLTTQGAVEVPESARKPYVAPDIPARRAPEKDLRIQADGSIGDGASAEIASVQDFTISNPLMPDATYATLLGEAMKKRPEIMREEANVAAAKQGITVARAGFLPSLSAAYNYSYTPNVGALGQSRTGYGSLTFSIPIFDSGATHGRVVEARAEVATAETNRRTQVDAVTLELRQAYLNLQAAELSLSAARESLAKADEAYKLARLRYTTGVSAQTGVSPFVELSNAQQDLSQSQSDYVNALYDYNNDRSTLDKAVGRYAYSVARGSKVATPTPDR